VSMRQAGLIDFLGGGPTSPIAGKNLWPIVSDKNLDSYCFVGMDLSQLRDFFGRGVRPMLSLIHTARGGCMLSSLMEAALTCVLGYPAVSDPLSVACFPQ